MGLKNYHLDSVEFLSVPRLAWQASLKKTEVKLELLTDIDKLLNVEKTYEEEYVMQFINMEQLITNIGKITMKIKNHNIINIVM